MARQPVRSRVLRALIVEDSPDDAELATLELRRSGYEVVSEVVATQSDYSAALARGPWDVILSDHNLPAFDGFRALKLLQDTGQDIPFIIVSGAIGEELAVAAMKAGASDYVLKGNLARLGPAVEREIREAAGRREQRKAEEALLLSEARLSGIVNSAMDAIISIGADQRIILFNKAAEEMFGYKAEEVIGTPLDLLLPERHRERHRTHIQTFAQTGVTTRAMGDLMTLEARRRNGEEVPIEATISQFVVSGRRHFTALIRDVTERVRAQEEMAASLREKEVLLREIHHRVKNNLQVVSSLLSLQAGEAEDPAAVKALLESESRVRAMGLVHDKLHVSEDIARVDFGEYLHSFVPQLVQMHGRGTKNIRMSIDAREVHLDVDIAAPLALIVNELVTNALKYAFPQDEGGEITITANMPDSPDLPLLTISDTGVGIPEEVIHGQSSLGLQLVWSLANQLGARLQWDIVKGTCVSVVRGRAQGNRT